MKTLNTKIILTILKEENRSIHGGYKYLLQCANSKSGFRYNCRAFHNKKDLKKWMSERGLTVGSKNIFWGRCVEIKGEYYNNMMMDVEKFNRIEGEFCFKLSNGRYTAGKITDEDGIKVINYLNPNCNRVEFKHDYINNFELQMN